MKRHSSLSRPALLALLFCPVSALAESPAPTGLLPWSTGKPAKTMSAPNVRIRGQHRVWLYARKAGEELVLHVRAHQIGRYQAAVTAQPEHDPKRAISLRPIGPTRQADGVLRFPAPKAGPVGVLIDTSSQAASVWPGGTHPAMVHAIPATGTLHVASRCDRLWFFVPKGTRRFAVSGRGAGGREGLRLTVFDPSGKPAGQAQAGGARVAAVSVAPAPEQTGRPWSFRADRPVGIDATFEDGYVWLSENLAPYVAPSAETLLVPFVSGLRQPPIWRGRGDIALRFTPNVRLPEGSRLHIEAPSATSRALSLNLSATETPAVLHVRQATNTGTYPLRVELRRGDAVLASADTTVTVTGRLVYVGKTGPVVALDILPADAGLPHLAMRSDLSGLVGEGALAVSLSLLRSAIPDPPGGATAKEVWGREIRSLGAKPIEIAPPAKLADGHYQWRAEARIGGELVDLARAHFLWFRGKVFSEVPPPPAGAWPVVGEADRERGFVCFVPKETDAIAYNHRPASGERGRPVEIELARDEYEPGTFGVWATRDVKGLRISAGPLRHEKTGAILPMELRIARHWPQRLSWNTSSYRIIPEMLEKPAGAIDLRAGEVRQVWLTVHADAGAKPGVYAGRVMLQADDGQPAHVPVQVRVHDFLLPRPAHVHWGLYPDTGRWRKYPDSQVRAELADIVAHGITTLMVYPPYHAKITYSAGRLKIDDTEFFRTMKMARSAGLRGPWVMSFQALHSLVRRLTGGKPLADPAFKKLFQQIVSHFVRRAKEEKLGQCVWHTIDEPWSPEAIRQATTELGYLKELGVTTFTTAGPVGKELDRVLDVRCYSIGHLLSGEAVLAEQTRRTRASGDRLWWYGSGCYTGQDGNVRENRYCTGLLFLRSGAEGVWSWTFLRTKGDAHNDFDGSRNREAKEACIVYPSTDRGAPVPTLQWEGIREGIDDYRYAALLRKLAPDRAKALEAEIPVRRRAGDLTTGRMQALRKKMVVEILKRQAR